MNGTSDGQSSEKIELVIDGIFLEYSRDLDCANGLVGMTFNMSVIGLFASGKAVDLLGKRVILSIKEAEE